MAQKFLRRTSKRYSKLGKGRKKKQIWRRPTGRDNKMREKRKGYPARVSIGYKTNKKEHKNIAHIENLKDFDKIQKDDIIMFGRVGKKKKIELAKKAKEKKIEISNLNVEKFLKKIEEKDKKAKEAEAKKKAEAKKSEKKKDVKKTETAQKKEDKETKSDGVTPKGVPRNISKEMSTGGKK